MDIDLEYDKGMGTGEGKLVGFHLKQDQIDELNELAAAFPGDMTRSDCIRAMVLPYVQALRLIKAGKQWEGALEYGKGLLTLRGYLKERENEERQAELDFSGSTVMAVPNQ